MFPIFFQNFLMIVSVIFFQDCLDEIKKRGDRFNLLDRHFSLLSPKFFSPLSQINPTLQNNSKRPPPLENISSSRYTPSQDAPTSGHLYTAKPRQPQQERNPGRNPYKSQTSDPNLSRHRSWTDLRSDQQPENDPTKDGYRSGKPYNRESPGPQNRSQELPGTYIAPLPEKQHHRYNQHTNHHKYPHERIQIARHKNSQLQKSAPNLAELDEMDAPVLENSMQLQAMGARGSYDTLDEILSPISNFSYSSIEANSNMGEDNAYEVLPSPVQPNATTAAWEDYVIEVPRENEEEDDSGFPAILSDGKLRQDLDRRNDLFEPQECRHRGFQKSVVINDDSETGHEVSFFPPAHILFIEKNHLFNIQVLFRVLCQLSNHQKLHARTFFRIKTSL